jgi:predicted transcriptional regulator
MEHKGKSIKKEKIEAIWKAITDKQASTVSELVEVTGFDSRVVDRILNRLEAEGKIEILRDKSFTARMVEASVISSEVKVDEVKQDGKEADITGASGGEAESEGDPIAKD